VDLGYLLVYFLPTESTTGVEGPVGTYNSIAHLIGLTVGVKWGQPPARMQVASAQ